MAVRQQVGRGRFGPLFAADIRRQRVNRMRGFRQWQADVKYITRKAA